MSGPLAKPEPWDLVATDYDAFVVPMFAEFSRHAIECLALPPSADVLDLACGPGTATVRLAEAGHRVWAVDFSEAMIERLALKQRSGGALDGASVSAQVMDGQALAFRDGRFDAAMSMFGLMFFPDRARGFAELFRVLKPGGRACVSSWLPVAEVPAMQWVFDAFSSVTPPPPPDAPPRQPILEDPQIFAREMEQAGFRDVDVQRRTHAMPMPDEEQLETFWTNMVASSAPIALFRQGVGEEQWAELNPRAFEHLARNRPTGQARFEMHAWLATGQK